MVGRHLCCCRFIFDRTLEGWALSVVVVPRVSSPKGSSSSVPRVLSHRRSSYLVLRVSSPKVSWGGVNDSALASRLFLGVSSPKESWGGRCCRARQKIVPGGFVPQGKLGRPMLLRSPENCDSGFRPPREAGAASMTPRSPAGQALLFVPGFRPPGEALCSSSGFFPPREAGAASMPRSPAGVGRR